MEIFLLMDRNEPQVRLATMHMGHAPPLPPSLPPLHSYLSESPPTTTNTDNTGPCATITTDTTPSVALAEVNQNLTSSQNGSCAIQTMPVIDPVSTS